MSKAEILEELSTLTKEERFEIRVRIAEMDNNGWLDEDDPLTDEEKALIEARIEAHEKDPASAIPWDEFDARLRRRLGE
jgi:putative addiction module component (TIGR02574 family)